MAELDLLKFKLKELFPDLIKWIEESIFPKDFFEYIKIVNIYDDEDSDGDIETICALTIFTDNYAYNLQIIRPNDKDSKGFISGNISLRKPHAGCRYSGSINLSGGYYSEDTWSEILKRIAGTEIVRLSPHAYSESL